MSTPYSIKTILDSNLNKTERKTDSDFVFFDSADKSEKPIRKTARQKAIEINQIEKLKREKAELEIQLKKAAQDKAERQKKLEEQEIQKAAAFKESTGVAINDFTPKEVFAVLETYKIFISDKMNFKYKETEKDLKTAEKLVLILKEQVVFLRTAKNQNKFENDWEWAIDILKNIFAKWEKLEDFHRRRTTLSDIVHYFYEIHSQLNPIKAALKRQII